MIVDSSALIALLLQETGWERIATAMTRGEPIVIGAPTFTETAIVLHAKGAPATLLPSLLHRVAGTIEPFTHQHALVAADAYAKYGRGRHPASLNFGDCMTYAFARIARAPLLFVGHDFASTDLVPAIDP